MKRDHENGWTVLIGAKEVARLDYAGFDNRRVEFRVDLLDCEPQEWKAICLSVDCDPQMVFRNNESRRSVDGAKFGLLFYDHQRVGLCDSRMSLLRRVVQIGAAFVIWLSGPSSPRLD